MTADDQIEDCESTCPFCSKPVKWKWSHGELQGVVSEPHNLLIGDFVAHADCFDRSYAEYEARQAVAGTPI